MSQTKLDKETQILSRLAANHLYLAQFEPLRAILLALRTRNRELARGVLQTIVAYSGRIKNILWSPSCSSPALLTYLSTLELLQLDNSSSAWNFDPESLRLRAEFLLIVQNLIDLVSETMRKSIDLGSIEEEKAKLNETENLEEQSGLLDNKGDDLRGGNGESSSCLRVLDGALELGVKRLRADVEDEIERSETWVTASVAPIEEGDFMSLKSVILDHADIFDALCRNIHTQIREWEGDDPSLAITTRGEDSAEVELSDDKDARVLRGIQKAVQVAHLDVMKESFEKRDAEGAVSHVRFLHPEYGVVEESQYRYALLSHFSSKNNL